MSDAGKPAKVSEGHTPTAREIAGTQWMMEATPVEIHDYAMLGSSEMCWHALTGRDRHCDLLRTPADV